MVKDLDDPFEGRVEYVGVLLAPSNALLMNEGEKLRDGVTCMLAT